MRCVRQLQRPSVWSGPALLLSLPLGCGWSRPAPHPPKAAATSSAAARAEVSAAPESSSAPDPPPPTPLLTDGCTSRIDLMLPGREKLASVAERCIAGMRPVWSEPWMARAGRGSAERTVPVADPSRCLRVAAAAGPGVTEIELVLLDPEGRPLAQDTMTGSVALIALDGPVCANQSGLHRLRVRAQGRDEQVATQVWQAP
jgi:hypothetical protein